MQIKYIADLHLFDAYSMNWRQDFKDLNDFADELVSVWNDFTSSDDIVIIVGDIGFNCPKTIETFKALKGHKVLVLGNHDITWGRDVWNCGVFEGVHDFIYDGNILVSHIPEKHDIHCSYFIHGHHHTYVEPSMRNNLKAYAADTYRLNCCCDLTDYHPMSLTELILQKEVMLDDLKADGYF